MRVEINQQEIENQELSATNLGTITQQLIKEGHVIIGGIIDLKTIDQMRTKLAADTKVLMEQINWNADGQFYGHISQAMPRSKAFINKEIVLNPMIIQVTQNVLGEGLHNHFYNCNTNIPGSKYQPLHRDAPYLDPDPINPIVSIIVNVPLIDVAKINGAIEVWPATHRILGSTRIPENQRLERVKTVPPIRLETRKGDVILRDPRLWHRGMPNNGDVVRHMIAMVHSKWYYQQESSLKVTQDALKSFNDEILTTRLELVPDDYDYLSENF